MSIIGAQEIYVDNFSSNVIAETCADFYSEEDLTDGEVVKVELADEQSLFDNFNIENELEVETEVVSSAVPSDVQHNTSYYYITSAYKMHAVEMIRVEFLDIFSPPPNS